MLEGLQAVKAPCEGKVTLRTHTVEPAPLPGVDVQLVREIREGLKVSRRACLLVSYESMSVR